ncbi:hypothetical protein AB0C87_16420 [Actinomadura sp. NPDC048021]|uniref:hypothetical protein n=1 Tax=Actinomadura sp. NPDC048021 TaxID=3155385 RepID=UPI0033EBC3F2
MNLEDAGRRARFLIRDRDSKFPDLFDTVLADAGIQAVLTWVRMPKPHPFRSERTADEEAARPPTAHVGSLSARRFRDGSACGGIMWHENRARYGQISTD